MKAKMNKRLKGSLMLVVTAFIFGSAFVAQKSGMDSLGPMAFNGIRTVIGGCALIPAILIMDRLKTKKNQEAIAKSAEASDLNEDIAEPVDLAGKRKTLIKGGIYCGLMLFVAGSIQQIGLFYTSAGKTGFITALYVVIVPVLGLLMKKRVRPVVWGCVLAATVGLYLLCIPAGSGLGHINKGDVLILISSFGLALHILIIDYFSPRVDCVKLSCIQFFVAGTLSLIVMYPIDTMLDFAMPTVAGLMDASFPLLYAAIFSCGVAYTFQVVAQSYTEPTEASLILCLESVFAVLSGFVLLGESMTGRELAGCVIMFAAIIAAQLPEKQRKQKEEKL